MLRKTICFFILAVFFVLLTLSACSSSRQEQSADGPKLPTDTNNSDDDPAVDEACAPLLFWGKNNSDSIGLNTGILDSSLTPVSISGMGGISKVSSGRYHSIVLRNDGTVWVWGGGPNGQLGDGTFSCWHQPIQVMSGVLDISSGSEHILALKNDGTVWAWGANGFGTDRYGQVGNNSTVDQAEPVQVFSDAIAIAAGRYHSVALKSDGTVWTWGRNETGQLGDNTLVHKLTPVQVLGVGGVGFLTDIEEIYAGGYHNVAVKNDGTLWTWGYNTQGQLGDNTTTMKKTPIQILGPGGLGFLDNVVSIYLGRYHSLFVRTDGAVWATGAGTYGQLGITTVVNKKVLTQVLGEGGAGYLSNISFVGGGQYFSFAVDAVGNIFAWGDNADGQLGDNSTTQRNAPVNISSIGPILQISGGDSHTLVLMPDNTVKGWGSNANSELASGPISVPEPSYVKEFNKSDVFIATAIGVNHSSALKTDGSVWTWGDNASGQLGDGSTTRSNVPVRVKSADGLSYLDDVKAIASRGTAMLALKNDGTVWAWGENGSGQLGDGTTVDKTLPVRVKSSDGLSYLEGITEISVGASFSIALKSDGTVWTWGANGSGQLGDDTTVSKSLPVQVKSSDGLSYLEGIRAIAAGGNSAVAIKNDGTVLAWGANASGQLGDNTTTNRDLPVQVLGLTDVAMIGLGSAFTVAMKDDGSIWSWGNNSSGQLADGTSENRLTPVRVIGKDGVGFLSDVIYFSCGAAYVLFLKADGTVLGAGLNTFGQIGEGTFGSIVPVSSPVEIDGVSDVFNIYAGPYRASAVKACTE